MATSDEMTRARGQYGRVVALCLLSLAALGGAASAQQCQGCGCKGGPGYRAANGRCVGWAEIGRTCGSPPTLRCTPELADQDAAKAAEIGVKALGMKRAAPASASAAAR
jgi:hypothetical protein